MIAAFIRQPNEFISKVVKLPKDACKVRTKYNHIFLKIVAVSLWHLLQDCFTTPVCPIMTQEKGDINDARRPVGGPEQHP